MAEKTRAYAARVDIDAPLERVWSALTTTAALERWMSPGTRVTAKLGGLFDGSLDRKRMFSAKLDMFDAPRRIRLVHLHPVDVPVFEGVIVDDILVEFRSPQTVVRVLGSGFPRTDEHGSFYMQRQLGWRQSLARLKVYLEKGMDLPAAERAALEAARQAAAKPAPPAVPAAPVKRPVLGEPDIVIDEPPSIIKEWS